MNGPHRVAVIENTHIVEDQHVRGMKESPCREIVCCALFQIDDGLATVGIVRAANSPVRVRRVRPSLTLVFSEGHFGLM